MALDGRRSSPSAIDMSIPVLQCMGNRINGDLVRVELPSTYVGSKEIPGDPKFKLSALVVDWKSTDLIPEQGSCSRHSG